MDGLPVIERPTRRSKSARKRFLLTRSLAHTLLQLECFLQVFIVLLNTVLGSDCCSCAKESGASKCHCSARLRALRQVERGNHGTRTLLEPIRHQGHWNVHQVGGDERRRSCGSFDCLEPGWCHGRRVCALMLTWVLCVAVILIDSCVAITLKHLCVTCNMTDFERKR